MKASMDSCGDATLCCLRLGQPTCTVVAGDVGVPSAGCLAVNDGDVLLVKIMGGTYGPPGGSVDKNESAQCAAERETWEETGVQVSAGELAAEFDNGFRLYWCEAVSGREVEISRPLEIQHADWYAPELFPAPQMALRESGRYHSDFDD